MKLIYYSPFTIYPLPFTLYHLPIPPFTIHHLPIPPFTIHHLPIFRSSPVQNAKFQDLTPDLTPD